MASIFSRHSRACHLLCRGCGRKVGLIKKEVVENYHKYVRIPDPRQSVVLSPGLVMLAAREWGVIWDYGRGSESLEPARLCTFCSCGLIYDNIPVPEYANLHLPHVPREHVISNNATSDQSCGICSVAYKLGSEKKSMQKGVHILE